MYLRLSVTDACDFRCWYCQPQVQVPEPACGPRLPAEDLLALVRHIHEAEPLRKVRITGGEPLLRSDLPALVRGLHAALPDTELTLTTNGSHLETRAAELRQAGLERLNLSLDSVDPARFEAITGRDALEPVQRGLAAARAAGFERIKLNAVLLRSGAGAELERLVAFAARKDAELRFIELMPLGPGAARHDQEFLPADEALAQLQANGGYRDLLPATGTAERHRFERDGQSVVVGFIPSVTRPFCARCDRLRLDSRGRLRACLRGEQFTDLAGLLPEGGEAVVAAVRQVVAAKQHPQGQWPDLSMNRIGG